MHLKDMCICKHMFVLWILFTFRWIKSQNDYVNDVTWKTDWSTFKPLNWIRSLNMVSICYFQSVLVRVNVHCTMSKLLGNNDFENEINDHKFLRSISNEFYLRTVCRTSIYRENIYEKNRAKKINAIIAWSVFGDFSFIHHLLWKRRQRSLIKNTERIAWNYANSIYLTFRSSKKASVETLHRESGARLMYLNSHVCECVFSRRIWMRAKYDIYTSNQVHCIWKVYQLLIYYYEIIFSLSQGFLYIFDSFFIYLLCKSKRTHSKNGRIIAVSSDLFGWWGKMPKMSTSNWKRLSTDRHYDTGISLFQAQFWKIIGSNLRQQFIIVVTHWLSIIISI